MFNPHWTQSWTREDNVAYAIVLAILWLGLLWLFHVPILIAAIATFGLCLWLGAIHVFYRAR